MEIRTIRNYAFYEVSSALQKAIRRSDIRLAGYWAIELWESGFADYIWKRLYTISAEDCWGVITGEIEALHRGYELVNAKRAKGEKPKGRIFIAKATILLCYARKSREADHLTNLIYDKDVAIPQDTIEAELQAARASKTPIPDYALDFHTHEGRRRGKTKADFFKQEFMALTPREPGTLDDELKKL